MRVFFRKGEVFDIRKYCCESDSRSICLGDQQTILTRVTKPSINCDRYVVYIAADSWTGQGIVSTLTQEFRYLVDDHA